MLEFDASAIAWRWIAASDARNRTGHLQPVFAPHQLSLADLLGIERQKNLLQRNTLQFLHGLPCNNALLWGARGTGKSSLVKALLNEYAEQGLRLVEVDARELMDLPTVVAPLQERKERFILFVDDLSFDADDNNYRTLKAALDGSVAVAPENVLIYATSNRRHLIPEYHSDNADSQIIDGELHHGEAVEEKISLSERFGIWLAFHPFSQKLYLEVVSHCLQHSDIEMTEEVQRLALRWALLRGNRSGRVAAQFARDYAGQVALGNPA